MRSLQGRVGTAFVGIMCLAACASTRASGPPEGPTPDESERGRRSPESNARRDAGRGNPAPTRAEQSAEAAVPVYADDARWGDDDAPVTIVAFLDLQCPFSARVQPTLEQLKNKYGPKQLRVVFKHNPLRPHPDALPAARVARAVLELGGNETFWKFVDLAYTQKELDGEHLLELAERAGVDRSKAEAISKEDRISNRIDRDIALAGKVTPGGTPSFRINGILVAGAQPIERFTPLIESELDAADELLAQGASKSKIYEMRCGQNIQRPATVRMIRTGPPPPKSEEGDGT